MTQILDKKKEAKKVNYPGDVTQCEGAMCTVNCIVNDQNKRRGGN